MYTDFTIKNFRIFDEEGTIVPLRTITILTGCIMPFEGFLSTD